MGQRTCTKTVWTEFPVSDLPKLGAPFADRLPATGGVPPLFLIFPIVLCLLYCPTATSEICGPTADAIAAGIFLYRAKVPGTCVSRVTKDGKRNRDEGST
jgi:hypothetical protein